MQLKSSSQEKDTKPKNDSDDRATEQKLRRMAWDDDLRETKYCFSYLTQRVSSSQKLNVVGFIIELFLYV